MEIVTSANFGFASILASLSAFLFYYYVSSFSEYSIKQKSWIVTLLSSTVMSCGSLPFFWDFCSSGGVVRSSYESQTAENLARVLCGSFQGFLLADLALGTLFYRQQITLLFGWVHHIVYASLMLYVFRRGWAPIFALCLAMEIPTAYLSASHIWPRWRNDFLYTIVFFLFRIGLHAVLIVHLSIPRRAAMLLQGSSVPSILLALAFLLHVSTFVQNVKRLTRVKCDATEDTTSTVTLAPRSEFSTRFSGRKPLLKRQSRLLHSREELYSNNQET